MKNSIVKRNLRKLERQKKHSGLTVHTQMFDAAAKAYRLKCNTAKSAYYNVVILEATDQGAVFKIADKLLQTTSDLILPKHDSPLSLANDFAQFFSDKVTKIQSTLTTTNDLPLLLKLLPLSHLPPLLSPSSMSSLNWMY